MLLQKKEAFYSGDGENMRSITHIDDVVAKVEKMAYHSDFERESP